MKVAYCPGSGRPSPMSPDQPDQWCEVCGKACRVRNDGCLARHPMDYARMVEHAAESMEDYFDRIEARRLYAFGGPQ